MEIERKFLIERPPLLEGCEAVAIEQGYLALASGGGAEVRVRRADTEFVLTIKGGTGEVRVEEELDLDEDRFESLWALTEGRRVAKTRHLVPLDGLTAEVDVYERSLAGLVVAEVEFETEVDADRFEPPDWFGRELTGDDRYSNARLAIEGRPARPGFVRQRTGTAVRVTPSDGQLTKVRRMVEDVARSREGKLAAGAVTAAAAAEVAVRELRAGSSEDDHLARARQYRLRTGEPVGRGVRRIAVGRVDDAVELLRDPEVAPGTAVHEARKDMKKLRSALRLVRPVIGEAVYRRENGRFRDAARTLSAARDAKVLAETIDALAERFADDPPPGGWDSVRDALTIVADDRDLDDLRRSAAAEIESGRREIQTLSLPGRPDDVLRAGLEGVYERGRRRMREAVSDPNDERLHELRKRVKDLWYHLRLLRDGSRELVEPLEDRADALSDLLGDDHDLAVLAAKLDDADSLDGDQRRHLHRLIDARRSELQSEALACAERLYKRKPRAFGKRLTKPWRAATA